MNKKRWLLYAVFGLFFYLLFLVIEMPAAWLAWGLNHYTQGAVRLDPTTGTLWSGNARLVIFYPQITPHDFGQVEWGINPLWLFAGRIQLSLQANHQDWRIKTTLGLARSSFMFKDTEAEFPAPFMAQLYTPLSLIGPQGEVRISASELMVTPEKVEGTVTLEWLNAGSSLSAVQPLGDYRLEINGSGTDASLRLATVRGALEFSGQGHWRTQTGQIELTGSVVPRERAAELESLLKIFGNDQGNGRRPLSLSLRLSSNK